MWRVGDKEFQRYEDAIEEEKVSGVCSQIFCDHCGGEGCDNYMVSNSLWKQAYGNPDYGYLHLKCLEERIGRKLIAEDFSSAPVNDEILESLMRGKSEPEVARIKVIQGKIDNEISADGVKLLIAEGKAFCYKQVNVRPGTSEEVVRALEEEGVTCASLNKNKFASFWVECKIDDPQVHFILHPIQKTKAEELFQGLIKTIKSCPGEEVPVKIGDFPFP